MVRLRAAECVELRTGDLNLRAGELTVARGHRRRVVGYGPEVTRTLDRYLRARRTHPAAASASALWLPVTGHPTFTYQGLASMLRGRAKAAGLTDVNAHRLRHSFACRWLANGGSADGLLSTAGWSDRTVIQRHGAGVQQERAVAEAKRLGQRRSA